MGAEEKQSELDSTTNEWTIPRFEPDDEYLQEMSREDLESLALKLKGYGEAADSLARDT